MCLSVNVYFYLDCKLQESLMLTNVYWVSKWIKKGISHAEQGMLDAELLRLIDQALPSLRSIGVVNIFPLL